MSGWTEERVERLKKLWDDGFSCSQIARDMDVTRNAVIGKVSRLKLTQRTATPGGASVSRGYHKRSRKPRKQPPEGWFAGSTAPKLPAEPYAERPDELPPPETPVSLADLEPHQCKFPYGHPGESGFTFCGRDAVPFLPYCETHTKRCYVPAPVPVKKKTQTREKEMA